ncbi:hypothetical protein [Acuticoccus kandeliae]|uniref:hypothetical protein n=1 Tax=Acuticoccus kandeliae TaxID=2073160 RepID=UPI001300AF7A|nr:hypothetical protein [Acuticoccus kandeliae]
MHKITLNGMVLCMAETAAQKASMAAKNPMEARTAGLAAKEEVLKRFKGADPAQVGAAFDTYRRDIEAGLRRQQPIS